MKLEEELAAQNQWEEKAREEHGTLNWGQEVKG